MDDALRVVVEMNETVWDRLKNALEDLSEEEIHWRPLPQANSINVIIRPHTWRCTVARSARFATCTAKRVESRCDSSRIAPRIRSRRGSSFMSPRGRQPWSHCKAAWPRLTRWRYAAFVKSSRAPEAAIRRSGAREKDFSCSPVFAARPSLLAWLIRRSLALGTACWVSKRP